MAGQGRTGWSRGDPRRVGRLRGRSYDPGGLRGCGSRGDRRRETRTMLRYGWRRRRPAGSVLSRELGIRGRLSTCRGGTVLVWAGGRTHASLPPRGYAAVDVAGRIGLRRGFRLPSAVGEVEAKPLGDELLPVDSIGFRSGGGGDVGSSRGAVPAPVATLVLAAETSSAACGSDRGPTLGE